MDEDVLYYSTLSQMDGKPGTEACAGTPLTAYRQCGPRKRGIPPAMVGGSAALPTGGGAQS